MQAHLLLLSSGLAVAALFSSCSSSNDPPPAVKGSGHLDIPLRNRLGQPLTKASTEPYSPRKTCGFCHNVDEIANGYHFQQGRTNAKHEMVVKADYFGDGRAFLRSAGMYGKW